MRKIRSLVREGLHSAGFELRRLSVNSNPTYQVRKAIERFEVNIVFDVGANSGQFARELRSVGYSGQIVSFEPLTSAHQRLCEAASKDKNWTVHPRGAIGDADGEATINVSANSVSSSMLPMLKSHETAAPNSHYVGSESTAKYALDSVAPIYISEQSVPFLKIDTQGAEWEVLDGAMETLPRLAGVLCEMSIVPLYEGQRLWLDLIRRVESQGFSLWSMQQGFTDPNDGRTLQVDAMFFRL